MTKPEQWYNFSQCFNIKYRKYTYPFFAILPNIPFCANTLWHFLRYCKFGTSPSFIPAAIPNVADEYLHLGDLTTIRWKVTEPIFWLIVQWVI